MISHIKRAKEGDPRATREVVEALRPRITKLAKYYARRTGEDADDLLQEAWLALLEALGDVDLRIGTPEHYLTARARWKILDTVKRARVRRCAPLDEFSLDFLPDPGTENAHAAACASDFAGQLKSTQQQVLDCLLAGFTWRETGDRLGCASANVAYHVRKIRLQYQEWLEEPSSSVSGLTHV